MRPRARRWNTCQPQPIITAAPTDGKFDTSRGTIHLILGGGGTGAPLDVYGVKSSERATTGQSHHQETNRPHLALLRGRSPSPARTRWKTPSVARRDTETATALPCLIWILGFRAAKRRSPFATTMLRGRPRPDVHYELFDTLVLAKTGEMQSVDRAAESPSETSTAR